MTVYLRCSTIEIDGDISIRTEYFFPCKKADLTALKVILDAGPLAQKESVAAALCQGISDKRMELLAERGMLCEKYQAGLRPPILAERKMKSVTNRLYKLAQNEGVVRKWQKDLQP